MYFRLAGIKHLNTPIKIVHSVNSISPSSGGPAKSVVGLAEATAVHENVEVTLISQTLDNNLTAIPDGPKVEYDVPSANPGLSASFGFPIARAISGINIDKANSIMHVHGIWSPSMHWAARFARHKGIRYVIQPHGMLEPWALNHHKHRKNIAMSLYQRRDLMQAQLLLATADSEYEAIRAFGLTNPVAVIPNGVDFPAYSDSHLTDVLGTQARQRRFLFLSRIHVKKGLLNLLQAWKAAQLEDWVLDIAGPDEGGHLADVMAKVRELGLEKSVNYISEVEGDHKEQTYLGADVFVLPTFSENFGIVVAEALSYGLPVITTKGTPWQDLETFGCGWWIDIGVEPLVAALKQAAMLSDMQRHQMGAKGRIYVQRYNWRDIADKMIDTYQWILGQGSKPDCVRHD
jgi:glycosyltransferase involved in cell wall biosynthesis